MAREIRTPKRKRKSWVVLVGKVQDLHAVTPQGTNTGVTTNTPILHADSYRLSFKYLDTGLPTDYTFKTKWKRSIHVDSGKTMYKRSAPGAGELSGSHVPYFPK